MIEDLIYNLFERAPKTKDNDAGVQNVAAQMRRYTKILQAFSRNFNQGNTRIEPLPLRYTIPFTFLADAKHDADYADRKLPELNDAAVTALVHRIDVMKAEDAKNMLTRLLAAISVELERCGGTPLPLSDDLRDRVEAKADLYRQADSAASR